MADPHVVLAPLVEPPLPPLPLEASVAPWALPGLGVIVVVLALVALTLWWWRRSAPQRALHRLCRLGDPLQAAQQLARWPQQYRRVAPAGWLQRLEQLRFGAPDAAAADTLQQLCREAAGFARAV